MAETQPYLAGLAEVVTELGYQIPLLEAQRAGAEMYGAPRLQVFDLLRPDENALSRVIGDLFDPHGSHGQGRLFLNELMGAIGLGRIGLRDRVDVSREVFTDAGRRIDLVIDTADFIIGIENKPWARQQHNQLADYLAELERRALGRRYLLVFISDQEPQLAREQVLLRLPYHQASGNPSLQLILSSTVDLIRATRTREFVEQFIRFVDSEFGEGFVMEETFKPYVEAAETQFEKDPAKRKAVATILLAHEKLHARIMEEVGSFLLNEVRKEVNEDVSVLNGISLPKAVAEKWSPWALRREVWPADFGVCLEASRNRYEGICYGVKAPLEGARPHPNEQKLAEIHRIVSDGKGPTAYWPWWQDCETNRWGPEFTARLIIESPNAKVEQHPEIQQLSRRLVSLVKAIERVL